MIITVASGKGGTGKTMVTSGLVALWGEPVVAVDLDVEEPNLHLFLHPDMEASRDASMEVPELVEENCTACGACSELCQFKAVSLIGETLLVFPEMCHGCGGCFTVCPADALIPGSRVLGEIVSGSCEETRFFMGRLRVGEAMSPPLMKHVKRVVANDPASKGRDVLVDGPPGVSCPAIEAVDGSDLILLVADSTPFGMHDFQLALEAFAPLNIPMAVVINNVGLGDSVCQALCRERGLPIVAEIPFDRAIASAYSQGDIPALTVEDLQPVFKDMVRCVKQLVADDQTMGRTMEVAHA